MTEPPNGATMPRSPAGLGSRGRSLWRTISADFVLGTAETEILGLACRTLDRINALEEALKGAPATVEGSQGQPRPHPLAGELRAEVLLASKLLAQLGIPTDLDPEDLHGSWQGLTPSERGKKAAARRWASRGHR
jgi:hypothetical protein